MRYADLKIGVAGVMLSLGVAIAGCETTGNRSGSLEGDGRVRGSARAGADTKEDAGGGDMSVEQVMKLMRLIRELAHENAKLEWQIANDAATDSVATPGRNGAEGSGGAVGLEELVKKADAMVHSRIDAIFFSLEQELYQRQERLRSQIEKLSETAVGADGGDSGDSAGGGGGGASGGGGAGGGKPSPE